MSVFNALVRDNVESIKIGNRYMDIARMFDSVREDSKRLIGQLDDGKISGTEKISNWWMKIRRGTPSDRFEEIVETYSEVAKDTKNALKSEEAIMDGYIDFRFALKEAEVLARELLDTHAPIPQGAQEALASSQDELDNYASTDEGGKSKLELRQHDQSRKCSETGRCNQWLPNRVVGDDCQASQRIGGEHLSDPQDGRGGETQIPRNPRPARPRSQALLTGSAVCKVDHLKHLTIAIKQNEPSSRRVG